jgi:hypothetical protein
MLSFCLLMFGVIVHGDRACTIKLFTGELMPYHNKQECSSTSKVVQYLQARQGKREPLEWNHTRGSTLVGSSLACKY